MVDDAQWLDRPSADALMFTARRLRAERLAMVIGAREGEVSRFEATGLPDLTLAGLDHEPAAAVLAAAARQVAPGVRERLLAEAHGNPLALLELPAALSAEQLDGRIPLLRRCRSLRGSKVCSANGSGSRPGRRRPCCWSPRLTTPVTRQPCCARRPGCGFPPTRWIRRSRPT
jgi:hypothetical protein